MSDDIMKERALFFLDRRIAALETTAASHTAMAEQAVSYAERRRILEQTKDKIEKNATELDAMQWLRSRLIEL